MLAGNAGNDFQDGGTGADTLFGDGGDDILRGGADADTLNGGPGADRFQVTTGSGADVVEDFEDGIDRIDLTSLGASASFTVAASGANTLVSFASGESLLLLNLAPGQISEADFFM